MRPSTLPGMAALLDRSCIEATGPDAAVLLQSLLSNDVDGAQPGGARLRAAADAEGARDLRRRAVQHRPRLRAGLPARSCARWCWSRSCAPASAARWSWLPSTHAVVWGEAADALASLETPAGPHRLLASAPAGVEPADAWEVARVEAGLPAFGREFDEDSMPAEAGLVPLAVSFTKGCYPGQEPVARLQYRGHANRGLRGLELSRGLPEPGRRCCTVIARWDGSARPCCRRVSARSRWRCCAARCPTATR